MFFHEESASWWFEKTRLLRISAQMSLFVTFLYRISEYMDLTPAEVVGHTCYHFIHVEDLENLRQSHEDCESHPLLPLYTLSELQGLMNVGVPVEIKFCPVVIGALCCHHHELPNSSWTSFLPSSLLFLSLVYILFFLFLQC